MSECVQRYLAALPDDYRIAILLHDAHGLSNPEIAHSSAARWPPPRSECTARAPRLRETLATACTFDLDERGVLVCDPQPESRTDEAG